MEWLVLLVLGVTLVGCCGWGWYCGDYDRDHGHHGGWGRGGDHDRGGDWGRDRGPEHY